MKVYKIRPVKYFGEEEFTDTGFTGEIKLEVPKYKERIALVKKQQDFGEDFEKISGEAYDACDKYISSIDLKHPDSEDVTNIDLLTESREGVAILFDVYNQILQGWQLSPKIVKP